MLVPALTKGVVKHEQASYSDQCHQVINKHKDQMDPLAQQSMHAGWGSPTEPIHSQPPSSASSSASYFTQSATPTSERSQEANISREPKIFGLPSPSLVSPLPRESGSGSGVQPKRAPPHLRVRISGLERNRKDLLVRFDASVSGLSLKRTQLTRPDESAQFQDIPLSQHSTFLHRLSEVSRAAGCRKPSK